jgi:hypothetical protein
MYMINAFFKIMFRHWVKSFKRKIMLCKGKDREQGVTQAEKAPGSQQGRLKTQPCRCPVQPLNEAVFRHWRIRKAQEGNRFLSKT